MRRRQVIALLALFASAWPLASRAQTGIKSVGVVYQGGPYDVSIEGLRDGLKAAGLEEGRDIAASSADCKNLQPPCRKDWLWLAKRFHSRGG